LAHVHLPSLSIITLTFLLLSTICVATVCSMYRRYSYPDTYSDAKVSH
jgi:hypothetical protein